MPFRRLVPAALCLLLLAVLTMRLGFPLIMMFALTTLLMLGLVVPWREVRTIMAGVLASEAVLWACVAVARVRVRLNYGDPWLRLTMIFVAVTLFCLWSAWLLWDGRKYDQARPEPSDPLRSQT